MFENHREMCNTVEKCDFHLVIFKYLVSDVSRGFFGMSLPTHQIFL